jgi:hypothetical protein
VCSDTAPESAAGAVVHAQRNKNKNPGRDIVTIRSNLKPYAAALLLGGLGTPALAQSAKPPIVLESTGAYEVGGKIISKPGDPSQTLS